MIRKRIFAFSLFTSLMVMAFAAPSAASDSCQPAFDALTKALTTPHHVYTTETTPGLHGGKPQQREMIYLPGKIYLRVGNKWITHPFDPKVMLRQEEENRKNGKATCQFMRNESTNGEAAALYSMQSESEDTKENAQVWISKSTGLPLREELDMDIGDSGGQTHDSTRYEYGNIQPPQM
jgi:hypothetical protein